LSRDWHSFSGLAVTPVTEESDETTGNRTTSRPEFIFTDADGNSRQPGFHDYRRTFARMADRAGVPHRTIMEIASWKSHAMLLRYLGKSKKEDQLDAFAKMAAFVKS